MNTSLIQLQETEIQLNEQGQSPSHAFEKFRLGLTQALKEYHQKSFYPQHHNSKAKFAIDKSMDTISEPISTASIMGFSRKESYDLTWTLHNLTIEEV